MTTQKLERIIEIAENYYMDELHPFFDFFQEIYNPLMEALESNDKTTIDYLMASTPEELFYIPIMAVIKGSEQPVAVELYDKVLKDGEHIQKILTALEKQSDTDYEAKNSDELTYHFDISADMVEGIHLSPKQIELWEKIIEREFLSIKARLSKKDKNCHRRIKHVKFRRTKNVCLS